MKPSTKFKIVITILLFSPFAISSQSLSDSLQAFYQFDKNTDDQTSNNHHLSTNTSLTWPAFLGQDFGAYFDGQTRIYNLSSFDNSSYTEEAVSLWINVDSNTNYSKQVAVQGAYMKFGVYISPNNKVSVFFDPPSAYALQDTANIADSKWHHIVAQNNGDTTFLYIDGKLRGTKYQPLKVGTGASNNRIYVGNSNLNTYAFHGSINDLRIYNRILTQKEIDTLSTFPVLTVGINDNKSSNKNLIKVYPNPSSDLFNFNVDEQFIGGTLKIYDIRGQVILNQRISNNNLLNVQLNTSKGLYFAEFSTTSGLVKLVKLVKK